eukprot:TRINITY_DN12711_c0_g1_i1.p1 TRINITY_DN12711_c0_g1~~TRINITY_DN12711_c0_g1_i1.p1  ORF type:complete len:219 (+),score=29.33 TRINITY_DN12711_c0_g1_i1:235-891(+)
MGVKCVFPCRLASDPISGREKLPTPSLADVLKRTEYLCATRTGSWEFSCSFLKPKNLSAFPVNGARELYVVSLGEAPDRLFLLAQSVVLEAEPSMQYILDKISLYSEKQRADIKGHTFAVGDFIIRVGTVMQANVEKGIIAEIEYLPCTSPNGGVEVLDEFISNFAFGFKTTLDEYPSYLRTNYSTFSLPTTRYTLRHATLQYVNCLAKMGVMGAGKK